MDQQPIPKPKAEADEEALLRSRAQIAGRLAEIVAWPATRIAPHERQLAGDILIGLLRTAAAERTMVFVNTRRQADRLEEVLRANHINAQALSGG